MKKFALKGLIVLAIAVALCMFFAGTVRTIVTPKVKIIVPKSGKLEHSVTLLGKLTFPDVEEIRIDEAFGQALAVTRVNVRAGYEIKAGDVLIEMEMTDYGERHDKLTSDYEEQIRKLADLDIKNRGLERTNPRNAALNAMVAAQSAAIERKVMFKVMCERQGIDVPGDVKISALKQYVADNGGDEALKQAAAAYAEAQAASVRAENNLNSVLDDRRTRGKEGVFEYLLERGVIAEAIAALEREMIDLESKQAALRQFVAPRDAYVVSVAVKAGDTYDGRTPVMTLSAVDASPVLRAEIGEIRQSVDVGAAVTIKGNYWRDVKTQVVNTGIDIEGKRYADIEITQDVLDTTGGIYSLMLNDVDMTLTYRARETTTLLPASAVRSDGENQDYVWVIRDEYGGFTGYRMVIKKESVTVLERGGKVVSIAEDMYNNRIADGEDRAIKDGDTVMEYVS